MTYFSQHLVQTFCVFFFSIVNLVLSPVLFFLERRRAQKIIARRNPAGFTSIFITGAGNGIGRELVRSYARPGVHLSIIDMNKEALANAAKDATDRGATVTSEVVDVRDAQAMREFILAADAEHPIDLVFANAGIAAMSSNTDPKYTLHDSFTDITQVNCQGVWNTIFPLVSNMCDRSGRAGAFSSQVVLMSSLSAMMPIFSAPDYAAGKAMVCSAGRSLRRYCEIYNVGVTVITPGFVRTSLIPQNVELPMLLEVGHAVSNIVTGVERNAGLVAFPNMVYFVTSTLGGMSDIGFDTLSKKANLLSAGIARRFFPAGWSADSPPTPVALSDGTTGTGTGSASAFITSGWSNFQQKAKAGVVKAGSKLD
ncbi:hypothetical protein H696_05834 [Fonticula alba]|uniref:NAD(P)-binding protein n=1 Tax=Fonticula alba TaxID=691883 RepID=A0A058Z0Q8_FONAL|nr:hypothetical protein H696_05834 [Fonticula alba]KCV67726.1 hypothetical protein H696_05834 [Fonticula alba]|eukprot:XP_009497910.1 hypothetical protein H696_05834 [Fonticula alba]